MIGKNLKNVGRFKLLLNTRYVNLLYRTKNRWISEIEMILSLITIPYSISLIALILGMIGNKNQIPLLWKTFHILEEHELYIQGPLLGLSLIWDKEHGINID